MITADYIVRNDEVVQRRDACACNEGGVYAVEKGSIAPVSAKRLEVRVGKYHRSSARAVERSDRAVQDSREDRIAPRHWLASDPFTVPKAYQIPPTIPAYPESGQENTPRKPLTPILRKSVKAARAQRIAKAGD